MRGAIVLRSPELEDVCHEARPVPRPPGVCVCGGVHDADPLSTSPMGCGEREGPPRRPSAPRPLEEGGRRPQLCWSVVGFLPRPACSHPFPGGPTVHPATEDHSLGRFPQALSSRGPQPRAKRRWKNQAPTSRPRSPRHRGSGCPRSLGRGGSLVSPPGPQRQSPTDGAP